MLERIRSILKKEFLQTLRDPRMRSVLILVPIIQSVLFGYAVNTDVKQAAIAVMDQDETPQSREFVSRFTSSGYFRAVEYVRTHQRARDLLDRGEMKAVLEIDSGFGNEVAAGRSGSVQMIVDGTDSNTAGILLNYAAGIVNQYNRAFLTASSAIQPPVELRSRAWFNENLTSRNFYVPGVIALLLALVTLMLSSMAIVREKEIGTIEQIIVTPITKTEFILGKTAPFALIGFFDVFLITGICVFWFDIPIRGSLLLLLASTALYILCTLGLGLLISTVSTTQQQAMMATFFVFFPSVLLSGFLFPIANMPEVIQWLTYFNPLRYMLVIIRGIFLKGIGVTILWPQMAALALLGTVQLWLASRRFQKTLA
jgi:ABC-2 type transport system permease protein